VVLRTDAVRERLLKLEEIISKLEELGASAARPGAGAFRDQWAAERGLQLGAEILLDIGNHILSAGYGVSAADYEDIITQLGERKVIDPPLRTRLKGLGGFRNVLVHGYLRIDPARVAEQLDRAPADFSAFAIAIRRWLAARVPEPS
jgi:uncharacterized protein YutE (UPF0331/DUF86 family)